MNALLKSRYIMSVALGCALYPLTLSKEMKQIRLFKHAMHFGARSVLLFSALPRIPSFFLLISIAYCSAVKPCFLTPGILCLACPPSNLECNVLSQAIYAYGPTLI